MWREGDEKKSSKAVVVKAMWMLKEKTIHEYIKEEK